MPFASRTLFDWRLRTRSVSLGSETKIMGILNVTPDSFSDGGQFFSLESAVQQALTMLDEGAHILDIGGESTRPNATPLDPAKEQDRVLPVIQAVLKERPAAIVSIDTFHAETARLAVEAGAEIVNDVSGFTWDAAMPTVCAELQCGVILMHTRGRPQEWPTLPPISPLSVMPMVLTGLRDSVFAARSAAIPSNRIVLDPGFGFGKIGGENYTILAQLDQLHELGLPILAGISRKRFLAQASFSPSGDRPDLAKRSISATTAANVAAILAGVHLLRVHEVGPATEASAIADAVLTASGRGISVYAEGEGKSK